MAGQEHLCLLTPASTTRTTPAVPADCPHFLPTPDKASQACPEVQNQSIMFLWYTSQSYSVCSRSTAIGSTGLILYLTSNLQSFQRQHSFPPCRKQVLASCYTKRLKSALKKIKITQKKKKEVGTSVCFLVQHCQNQQIYTAKCYSRSTGPYTETICFCLKKIFPIFCGKEVPLQFFPLLFEQHIAS